MKPEVVFARSWGWPAARRSPRQPDSGCVRPLSIGSTYTLNPKDLLCSPVPSPGLKCKGCWASAVSGCKRPPEAGWEFRVLPQPEKYGTPPKKSQKPTQESKTLRLKVRITGSPILQQPPVQAGGQSPNPKTRTPTPDTPKALQT